MAWYAYMINGDREDAFERKLNITEYLASFINPQAIQQIHDTRENQKVVPEKEFDQQIRDMFGRDLTKEAIESGTRAEATSIEERPEAEIKKPGAISIDDLKKYADMSDVKFYSKKK